MKIKIWDKQDKRYLHEGDYEKDEVFLSCTGKLIQYSYDDDGEHIVGWQEIPFNDRYEVIKFIGFKDKIR